MRTINNSPSKEKVKSLFSSIADGYDLANDIMTLGQARLWRKKIANNLPIEKNDKILDGATGTGDLAYEFSKKGASVTGVDFCESMLVKARKKYPGISFELGDLTELKYPDKTFSISSVAYGLRNVEDFPKAISELARVTKKSGYIIILETGKNPSYFMKPFLNFYMKVMVPFVGSVISKNKEAYQYLQKSSFDFPSQEELVDILNETNLFSSVRYESLLGGASYLYFAKVK